MKRIFLQLTVIVIFLNLIQSCKKDNHSPVNQPPVADAGSSKNIALPTDTITLNGSASDSDGKVVSYLWSEVSGPNAITITNPGSPSALMNGLVEGNYLFQLMVTDNQGATGVDTVSVTVNPPPVEPCKDNGIWQGVYGTLDQPNFQVTDQTFIANGIATLTNSPWSYFYSSVQLIIPSCRIINADTVRLEVSLKNSSTGVNALTDYDASIWLDGSLDTAHVQYIGYRPEFTSFGINQKQITNSTNLLYVFEDWTTVTLEAKNNELTTKRNGTLIESLSYNGYQIGRIKQIDISFKGSGSVDWVKLYSSKSNRLLMEENFNINGQSNLVWY